MKIRYLTASAFGNILEWFDIGLFIYLSPFIGKQFFPEESTSNATLMVFSIFAAGFICRPLGSILFGHFAPAYYLMGMSMISLLVIFSLKETFKTVFLYEA